MAEQALQLAQATSEATTKTFCRLALGQVLWQTGGDRPRAIALVKESLGELGPEQVALRRRAEAWLAGKER